MGPLLPSLFQHCGGELRRPAVLTLDAFDNLQLNGAKARLGSAIPKGRHSEGPPFRGAAIPKGRHSETARYSKGLSPQKPD